MSLSFRLPDLGEGVMEGEIVAWHVAVGDQVEEDQPMVEVMTDKATVTIGAPIAGAIAALRFDVGDTASVGDELLVIANDAEAEGAESQHAAAAEASPATRDDKDDGPAATAVGDIKEGLPGTGYFQHLAAAGAGESHHHPLATPAVRRVARERGVDLSTVTPSGPGGRILIEDLPGASAPEVRASLETLPDQPGDMRSPFIGMRRKIAQRLQHSKRTAAHFTFVEEVDASALMVARDRAPVGTTYLPFIVKAAAMALRAHPALNSYLDEEAQQIVTRARVHVGVATATDEGLMVPVVQDADQRSVADIAREITRLAEGARAGTLPAEVLRGGTFTVTSLGKLGGLLATPVLNYPEVGILGVHRIKRRPVVRGADIVIGHVMNLSLSFDHRIIDGHVGAAFAYDIIERLEGADNLR